MQDLEGQHSLHDQMKTRTEVPESNYPHIIGLSYA
jgi:hypothetical protein